MWLAIHILHILAFLGCLSASGIKLGILVSPALDAAAVGSLRKLDAISLSSSVLIVVTGIIMLAAEPGRAAHLSEAAFQLKILLFVVASSLVVTTKGFLRRTTVPADGQSIARPNWVRLVLLIDFASIIVVAATGAAIAHGVL